MPAEGQSSSRRRLLLMAGKASAVAAATAALASGLAASAALASTGDANILAMLAEIVRLAEEAEAINEVRVYPHEDEFEEIMKIKGWDAACAFAATYGRGAAVDEANALL
jgi:precorrin-3B methylase